MNKRMENISMDVSANDHIKKKTGSVTILVFSAHWLSTSSILEIIAEKLRNSSYNLDVQLIYEDENPEILSKFRINKFPTYLILQGNELKYRKEGLFSKQDIFNLINNLKQN